MVRRRGSPAELAILLPYLYAAIAVIAVWWAVVLIFRPDKSLLPSPWLTAQTFVRLTASGELPSDAAYSVFRVLAAWSLAAVVAIPLGFAMGRWRRLERVLDPVVELFRPISPLASIPLAILWFGIDEGGKIFVIFIGTFFPILLNTITGANHIDPVLIRAGRILGCPDDASLFRKVVLPAAMPQVIVGLRISFGTGWAAIIAAELVAGPFRSRLSPSRTAWRCCVQDYCAGRHGHHRHTRRAVQFPSSAGSTGVTIG